VKTSALALCGLLLPLGHLSAQVSVEVTLDQEQFLPGEALVAAVRITNRSGQTLNLGADPDWLTFGVESRDGYVVLKTGDVPVVGAFSLESSKRAIKRVNLAPYFNLVKPGRYAITATVAIKKWNQAINSPPKLFDIIEGANLWQQQVGVPPKGNATNSPPEVRNYTLQEANHLRQGLVLYLRLTDGTGRLNKVFPIGPMLSFGQPDAQLDRLSNLHILFQNGPRSFNHTVVNTHGDVIEREVYEYTTRPRLQMDTNGDISVLGGMFRPTMGEILPAIPTGTNSPAPKP
jgi:hypothetical protein